MSTPGMVFGGQANAHRKFETTTTDCTKNVVKQQGSQIGRAHLDARSAAACRRAKTKRKPCEFCGTWRIITGGEKPELFRTCEDLGELCDHTQDQCSHQQPRNKICRRQNNATSPVHWLSATFSAAGAHREQPVAKKTLSHSVHDQ